MLNYIWLAFLLIAVLVGGFTGKLPEMTKGAFETAGDAVMKIALPLAGLMALWLGIMRLAERSGLVQVIARVLRPLLRRLFPEVPPDHPAMGAMVMNMAANMLGLGNAATPLGLRAIDQLERLNPRPGTATNAMCTFLAINTASIQLVPTTAIAILAVNHARDSTAIVLPAFLATCIAACSGVTAAKLLERLPIFKIKADGAKPAEPRRTGDGKPKDEGGGGAKIEEVEVEKVNVPPLPPLGALALALFAMSFVIMFGGMAFPEESSVLLGHLQHALHLAPTGHGTTWAVASNPDWTGKPAILRMLFSLSALAVPFLLSFFPLYAALRGVKVYEQFVEGAKEAFGVATRIVPFLVAMLVALRLLRDSGVIALLTAWLGPVLTALRLPPDLLPLVLMRPLSGSATMGIFVELVQHLGPDNLVSRMAATIFGSTETTFYVIAVYFGSVAVRQTRHAILAGLTADTVAVIASITLCRHFFA